MSIAELVDKQIRKKLSARAVYPVGYAIQLGNIVERRDDVFRQVGDLSDYDIKIKRKPHQDTSLDLSSSGARGRVFQANVDITKKMEALDLAAQASVEYDFASEQEFILKTPALQGEHITNETIVKAAAAKVPGWKFKDWYIVIEVYNATDFTFVASKKKNSTFSVSGSGAGILKFLTAGAKLGLAKKSVGVVEFEGKTAPVAIGVVRVEKP